MNFSYSGPMNLDAHLHVFHDRLPLRPERRYTPGYSATTTQLLAQLDAAGVHGAVLVQPSFLADHDYLLAAAAQHPDRLRAVVSPADRAELQAGWGRWVDAGVVGVRLNLVGRELPDLGAPQWRSVGHEMSEGGIHLEIHASGDQWPGLVSQLADWPSDVVIDHLGRAVDVAPLIELGTREHVWFKASAPYRWPDGAAAGRLVGELLERTGGERLLWGSDWPFTQHESEVNYAGVLAEVTEPFPDVAARADANLQRLLGQRAFDR